MLWGLLEFLWGLGLFLFGMRYLTLAVEKFSKTGFKKLIKRFTSNAKSAVVTGFISTIITQSSNLMSVLVLAFVGTGLLSVTGGIAVMLGSNIWTVVTDALLATIGLHFDIKMITFPLLFLGAIGLTFFINKEKVVTISKTCIAISFSLLAFAFMKEGLDFLTQIIDLSKFTSMNPRIFFWIGLVLATLMQSWGTVFIISITSANAGLIPPETAFPLIFGAYLGSTATIFIASLGQQSAIKKQVAYSHIGFNLLVAMLGMLCLPLIKSLFISTIFPRFGTVISLSGFYVGRRLIIAIGVFPFLWKISEMLQAVFVEKEPLFALAIKKIDPISAWTELGILALKQDILFYFQETIEYNLNIRDLSIEDLDSPLEKKNFIAQEERNFTKTNLKKKYQETKAIQAQLLLFLAQMNQNPKQTIKESEQLTALYQIITEIGDSSKTLKDVRDRVEDWQRSSSENQQKDYETQRKMVLEFYWEIIQIAKNIDSIEIFSLLNQLMDKIENNDKKYLKMFKQIEGEVELVNLIQINRYFSASCLSLLKAIESFSLSNEEKKYIKEHIKALF